eukprot:768464-Hanusia_phi.AAC.5
MAGEAQVTSGVEGRGGGGEERGGEEENMSSGKESRRRCERRERRVWPVKQKARFGMHGGRDGRQMGNFCASDSSFALCQEGSDLTMQPWYSLSQWRKENRTKISAGLLTMIATQAFFSPRRGRAFIRNLLVVGSPTCMLLYPEVAFTIAWDSRYPRGWGEKL